MARDTGARPLDTRTPPGARPPQDPERVAAANRRVVTFGVLMLTTLFCLQLDLPWQAISLVTAIASLVAGVRALTAVWRAGARGAPIVVLSSVLMMAGLLTLATVGTLLLWPVQMERQDCLRGALTISAQEQCQSAFQEAIQERLSPGVGTEP